MKSWMDCVTDKELIWFLKKEFGYEKITAIKRHKRNGEITCNLMTLWVGEPEDHYKDQKGVFPITDKITITQNGIDCGAFDTSYLDKKWQQFLYAVGYRPMAENNPYLLDTELQSLRFDEEYERGKKKC